MHVPEFLRKAVAKVRPPQRIVYRLVGDPRNFRCSAKQKRAFLGCKFPRKCPTCRQFTRQWRLTSEPGAWRCGSCGHAYLKGKLIVHRTLRSWLPWRLRQQNVRHAQRTKGAR